VVYGYFYLAVSVAIIIVGGFLIYQMESSASCLPKDISQVKFGFHVNVPSVIPSGYSLQGIQTTYPLNTTAILYYADHPVCVPLSSFFSAQLLVTIKNYNLGEHHAIFSPNGKITGYNETNHTPLSSLEFQQDILKTQDDPDRIWQPIEINSYKGLEREYYHYFDNDVKLVHEILFLNDKDQVTYEIAGNFTLNQLLSLARSMS